MHKHRFKRIVSSQRAAVAAGATTVPVGKGDTVTIGGFLNTDGSPYTGADPTIVATSPDPASLQIDTPNGLTYDEHFLAAGTFDVKIEATFPGGVVVTETDTVTLTPIPTTPGSFTVTHSLPV